MVVLTAMPKYADNLTRASGSGSTCLLLFVVFLLAPSLVNAASALDYYKAGEQAYQGGQHAKAVEYFRAAVQLDSAMDKGYYMLGNSYIKLGNKPAAQQALQAYLRLKPGDTKIRNYLASLGSASAAKAPPRHPAGSVIVFEDHFNLGVKARTDENKGTKYKEVRDAPAFGSHCLYFRGDPKKKSSSLTLDWAGAWAASGLKRKGDLGDFQKTGAIVFWIKGKHGGETFDLTLMNPAQADYGNGHFSNTIPLAPYVATTTEWQKVIVPLKDFREKGFLWGSFKGANDSSHYKLFDWNQVISFQLATMNRSYAGTGGGKTGPRVASPEFVVFIDQLMIVPRYSPAEYQKLREQSRKMAMQLMGDGKGNIVIFDDKLRTSWWSSSPAPFSRTVIDETAAKVGKRSFQVHLDPKSWSWSGGGLGYFDFTPIFKTGSLQFWIKGKNGEENFTIGFDSINPRGRRVGTMVDIRRYVTVGTGWQKVKIPLVDFPVKSRTWPEGDSLKFHWAGVNMIQILTAPTGETETNWWFDDLKVMAK